ncbi:MAG: FtsX-like permease family protein [Actinomycetes bacterium]
MFRAALRSLRQHKLRLVLTLLAVVVGVAFVAGTYIFTDSLKQSFDALFNAPQPDVTVSVDSGFGSSAGGGNSSSGGDQATTLPASTVQSVAGVPGVAAAFGVAAADGALVIGQDGKPIGRTGPPSRGTSWIPDQVISSLRVTSGAPPVGPGQVALLEATARAANVSVGDTVTIETPGGRITPEVVGLVTRGISGSDGGTLAVFDLPTAEKYLLGKPGVTSIAVRAQPGVSQQDLAKRIEKVVPPGSRVQTGAQRSADIADRLQTAFGFINTFLLTFAFIALFVAIFLIFNTFSMLVAQRTREIALLRAVGASRGQIRRSVLAEAAVLGLIAAVLGVLGGILVSFGLRQLLKLFGADLPAAPLVIQPRTIVVSLVIGVLVTVISAYLPSRRAARVPPVAAMRDEVGLPARDLRVRTLIGIALLALSALAAYLGLHTLDNGTNASRLIGFSALSALIAVIALSPILGKFVVGVLGFPFRRTAVGRLAIENGRRNPRRTAATASALAIGLALMSAIGVIAASTKASVAAVVDDTIGADYLVIGAKFQPFRPEVYNAVKDTPGASAVAYVRQVPISVKDKTSVLSGVQPDLFPLVVNLQMQEGSAALGLGEVIVDDRTATDLGLRVGKPIQATLVNGSTTLVVRGIYKGAGPTIGYFTSIDTLSSVGARELDSAVYVRVAKDSSPDAVKASLTSELAPYPAVVLQDQASLKDQINASFDQVFGFIYALLALAVIVAFLGIVNTLALSVFERRREVGLLRAVGTSRSQIRRMVVLEAVLISIFGAVLGICLGVAYGALLQKVLEPQGITQLAIPFGQIGWFVVLAVVGGLVAALWPAFTASRLDVLKAIASE